MPSELPRVTLRLTPEDYYKLRYIADDNFRPVNSELTILVRDLIARYEAEHGEITLPKDS